ncbi:MAG: TrkA family potassium uptake protein [Candidatus Aenigmarchaeota archaeon]|nr:TrkA family potassium uptake protein [Candidatus Aenigmarchaeota archaeon]
MRVIIAGGGEFGVRLAESLSKENEVIIIEKDEGRAEYLGEKLSSIVLFGDAAEKDILKHANAEKCDALLAVTGNDKVNSAICELGKSFEIKKLAARINDPGKTDLFSKSGAVPINIMDSAVKEFRKVIEKPHK